MLVTNPEPGRTARCVRRVPVSSSAVPVGNARDIGCMLKVAVDFLPSVCFFQIDLHELGDHLEAGVDDEVVRSCRDGAESGRCQV